MASYAEAGFGGVERRVLVLLCGSSLDVGTTRLREWDEFIETGQ